MSSRTNKYIKGLTSTGFQKILTKLIGFVVTPIVLSYLGKNDYGVWIIIGSFIGYMGLMDFGITGSVTQLIAKNNNEEDKVKINSIVNNSFFLQIIIGVIIILIGVACSFFFPEWFNIESDSKDIIWLVFLLAAVGYGISLPPRTLQGLIQGRQYISLAIWLEFFLFISTTLLNLLMLELGFGLLALPIGTIAIRLVSYFLFFKIAKKTFPDLELSISYFNWKEAKGIFKVSSVWFIGGMSAVIIYSSDTMIIGSIIGTGIVTTYVLTYRLSEVFRHFIYTIGGTAMPGLGQLSGQGEVEKVKNIFFKMFPFVINTTLSAMLFLIFFNKEFVRIWVGSEFYGGDDLNTVFAFTLFTTVIFYNFSIILSSGLNLKAIAISRSIEAALNIIISLILVHKLGLLGVALGTVIASILTSFWVVPFFATKHLKISFYELFSQFKYNIGLPLLIYISFYFLTEEFLLGQLHIMWLFFIWLIISLAIVWIFALPKDLKGKVVARVIK